MSHYFTKENISNKVTKVFKKKKKKERKVEIEKDQRREKEDRGTVDARLALVRDPQLALADHVSAEMLSAWVFLW
jgi:hypothetical protein